MPILEKKTKQSSPARTLALGFIVIIAAGALLLFLPISSKSRTFTNLVDCLFTAASYTCVTGISVVDTYSHWSVFGQVVIMLLMQVGGLGFITLVTFFNIAVGKKLGFMKASAASGGLTMTGLSSTGKLFTRVVILSLVIETIGALLLMIKFVPAYGGYGIFMAFFTAISSFCNAGIDLFGITEPGIGMAAYENDPFVLTVIMLLILIGGLGFVVWEELIAYRKERTLSLHSRVVLIASAFLIVSGTVVYFIIGLTEPETFSGYSVPKLAFSSLFASVSTRSAGFVAAPLPMINSFAKMFTIILMFIGAAPGSTGGGFKVTTVAIIAATAWSVLKGREDTQLLKHTVSKQVVYKTLTILCLSLGFIITGSFIISLINPDYDSLDVLFEVVAVFSTAGYTTGLSESAGPVTKLILSFIMYAGRIGPVSFMLSFAGRTARNKNEILPRGDIMVG